MSTLIQIPSKLFLNFCIFNNQTFLVVSINFRTYYVLLPKKILVLKRSNFLNIQYSDFSYERPQIKKTFFLLDTFRVFLLNLFKKFEKPLRKKLILKGLGLKVRLLPEKKVLEFKLGFSHLIYISVPKKDLQVYINKNIITIESPNSVELGNFIFKIRALKIPNIYKGKGIWYKNEIRHFKIIKKI